MPRLDFYFDVVCPFAFMAFGRLDHLRQALGVELRLRPVLLGGLLRDVGGPLDANLSMAPARAAINRRDILNWASAWELPLHIPSAHPRRSVEAMRLCVAAPEASREAVVADLFEAYWLRGEDIVSPEVLASVASRHGLPSGAWRSGAAKAELRAHTSEAAAAGAFGVPTFKTSDRVVWGQDRWQILASVLGRDGAQCGPAWQPTARPATARTTVRFFHDFASPFSYLASTQLDRVARRTGAKVERLPILLGGLFAEIGTPGVPLFEMNPAKQAYVRTDLDDWARLWGVPFTFPRHFPMRSVLPLRAALVEPAVEPFLYAAAWANDQRIDEPAALAEVLTGAGFDAAAILAGCARPDVKAQLRSNTEAAIAAGGCGAPTFVVQSPGEPEFLLWGQDRIVMLDAVLGGWRPTYAGAAGASDGSA